MHRKIDSWMDLNQISEPDIASIETCLYFSSYLNKSYLIVFLFVLHILALSLLVLL